MLIDANLLLFAVHRKSAFHEGARDWLTEQLNGPRRVGLPWQSLAAFLRITTHPRAFVRPLDPVDAWARVSDWLSRRCLDSRAWRTSRRDPRRADRPPRRPRQPGPRRATGR